jgi:protease-4
MISLPLFSQGKYLEINLNSSVSTIRSVKPKPLEVLRVIDRAGKDNNIKGILLNIGKFSGERDYIWELRNALEQFSRKGKKICAFISSADIDTYCLASVADKIVMDEQGILTMLGYSWGRGYVKHSLEKLGINVRELRYLEYKSAAETFTRDSLSEADKKQYGEYLDNIYNLTCETIINARNWTEAEFNTIVDKEFLFSARSALNSKLIDRTGRKDAVFETINEIESTKIEDFVLYGDSISAITKNASNYGPAKTGGLFKRPPIISIVYAKGETDLERGMETLNLSRTICELADAKRVKAIVLRINSPGGSAEAADYLAEAVRYATTKKPVVVSMGEVAASGGYWAAMYANHIMATPYTITGSIGVIGSWFYDNGFGNKLGLTIDSLQRGLHADMMTGFILPHRDLTTAEEARYKAMILDMYVDFVSKAAIGRKMEVEKMESLAKGRVYSGKSALEAGIIDSMGGIYDAILKACELAEIDIQKGVVFTEYPKPKFWDKIFDRIISSVIPKNKTNNIKTSSSFLDMFLPIDDVRYRLENNGRIMPILPLEFRLRYASI